VDLSEFTGQPWYILLAVLINCRAVLTNNRAVLMKYRGNSDENRKKWPDSPVGLKKIRPDQGHAGLYVPLHPSLFHTFRCCFSDYIEFSL